MADTYPVRQDPLPLIKTPSLPTTGQIGMKEVLGIQEPYMKEKARLIPEIGAARGAVEEAKQAQQVIGAEGEAKAAKDFAAAEKGAMQQYQGKMEREPLPAFVPSKENAQDLAMLFSLVSVIGMVVGGGAKENSQAAMSAMNGMLEGHQKGRADLYKQELSTFDKNFKSMVQKHAEFRKEMEDAVKLASTDKEGAMADAKLAAAKAGSNITKAMLDQGRLLDAYKFVDESQAGVDKAVAAEAKLRADAAKEAAAERRHTEALRHAEQMRKLSEAHAERMARQKVGAGGVGSDTASDVKNFTGVNFGTGKQADTKYDQVAAAANTMAEALSLSNAVRKNPSVVGRVGQAKGFIDRYVKSLSSEGLETDKTPTPTTKEEQDALLFSKRYAAYLIRYEQALAGSAKGFTVAFMKRFNSLMQQDQFNPEGFDGLMREQIREIHARTASLSTKITPESLMRLGVAQTRDPDAIEALSRMQGGVSAAPAAAASAGPGGSAKRGGATASVDEERSRAKAAIAAGAPEAAVKERFKAKTGQEL